MGIYSAVRDGGMMDAISGSLVLNGLEKINGSDTVRHTPFG